jgi:2'-hydroxyisoflavone reductase
MIDRRQFLTAATLTAATLPFGPVLSGRPLKLLILGGTGFLGPHTVRAALAQGHQITLFNRGRTNNHLFPELEKLRGDRDGNLEALKGRKWDAVIDTSGYVPRLVADSAGLLAPNTGQYIFISSISVYADFTKRGMDETAPVGTLTDPTTEEITGASYGPLKALCEQAAEQAMPGRTTIIRPGLIGGPGDRTDRFTYWPVRVARGGDVLAPGNPNAFTQLKRRSPRGIAVHARHVVSLQESLGVRRPVPLGQRGLAGGPWRAALVGHARLASGQW